MYRKLSAKGYHTHSTHTHTRTLYSDVTRTLHNTHSTHMHSIHTHSIHTHSTHMHSKHTHSTHTHSTHTHSVHTPVGNLGVGRLYFVQTGEEVLLVPISDQSCELFNHHLLEGGQGKLQGRAVVDNYREGGGR